MKNDFYALMKKMILIIVIATIQTDMKAISLQKDKNYEEQKTLSNTEREEESKLEKNMKIMKEIVEKNQKEMGTKEMYDFLIRKGKYSNGAKSAPL
jgi:hypothetical protein